MIYLQWLMSLALAIMLPVAIALILKAASNDKQACLKQRLGGIRMNCQIKQLLTDLQQHRGMVNAFLSGDKSFGAKISKKQEDIERDMATLDNRLSEKFLTPERWQGIHEKWKNLRLHAMALPAEQSFQQHSELIRDVLHCIGDVAERTQVGGNDAIDPLLVSVLWSKLPAAAEGVGQARGMGASVAAKGYCSSVSRIKLRFLEGRIRETMGWVSDDLERADLSKAGSMRKDWETANAAVMQLLIQLENSLLNVEHPTLDAAHYFETATKALDAVFRVYDQVSASLESAAGAGPK